jgi:C-terminal processing protease CtpA/Prc
LSPSLIGASVLERFIITLDSLVWEDSPAAKAGLKLVQYLTSINGVETKLSIDGIQRALQAMSGQTIKLEWEGGATILTRELIFQP